MIRANRPGGLETRSRTMPKIVLPVPLTDLPPGSAPTAPSREYVYGGGTLLAKIDSSGTKYYHQDHLSNRLVTSSTGATVEQIGHYPFGDPWYNATSDKLYFTSYERDAESGNDYSMARYYVWRLARFISLDPHSGSIGDPQSLDRYTYVGNDPVKLSDPGGTCPTGGANPFDGGSGHAVCTQAAASAGVEGGGFFVDGIEMPGFMNGMIEQMLSAGSLVQCKNNTCSGWTENGEHATFIAEAGLGFQGTLRDADIAAGFYYVNGMLISARSWQAYVRATYSQQIDAQRRALAQAIAANSNGTISYEQAYDSLNASNGYLQGGNYNFGEKLYGPQNLSCGASRCNGIHFPAAGFVHLDTSNPSTGPLGFLEHSFVDVLLGNTAYTVIPRPWP